MSRNTSLGRGLGDLFSEAGQAQTAIPSVRETYSMLPVARLRLPAWMNTRNRHSDRLEDLALSISEEGILQPILVRKAEGGHYDILSGARRYAAALRLGMAEVPCLVRACDDDERLDLYLEDNLLQLPLRFDPDDPGTSALCEYFDLSPDELNERLRRLLPEDSLSAPCPGDSEQEPACDETSEPVATTAALAEQVRRSRRRAFLRRMFPLGLAGLAVMALGVVVALRTGGVETIIQEVIVEVPVPVPAPPREHGTAIPGRTIALPRLWAPPQMLNALPYQGISLRFSPARIDMFLDQPVFTPDSRMTGEARELLRQIAEAIRPHTRTASLLIATRIEDDTAGTSRQAYDTALLRAAVAAEFMRRAGSLPPQALRMVSEIWPDDRKGDIALHLLPVWDADR